VGIVYGAYVCLIPLVTSTVDPPYEQINRNIQDDILNENQMLGMLIMLWIRGLRPFCQNPCVKYGDFLNYNFIPSKVFVTVHLVPTFFKVCTSMLRT
jgi:hypothetical protein